MQEQEEGSIRAVVYLGRTLDKRERASGVTEKECLAMVWACAQLRVYLKATESSYGRTRLPNVDSEQ